MDKGYGVWVADVTESIRHLRLANAASVVLLSPGHGQHAHNWFGLLVPTQWCISRAKIRIHAATGKWLYRPLLSQKDGQLFADLKQIVVLIAADWGVAMAPKEQKPLATASG